APRGLQPPGQIEPAKVLNGECGLVEEFAAPVRLAHHPRRRVACLERGRPVTLIGERLIPGEARLRPLRLSRDPLETADAVRTKDGFAAIARARSPTRPSTGGTVGGASPTAE